MDESTGHGTSEVEPHGASAIEPNDSRRRGRTLIVVLACLVTAGAVVAGLLVWRVTALLPTGRSIGEIDSSQLSESDRNALLRASKLGERASSIGGGIGGLALAGDSEGLREAGNKLVAIGHELLALADEVQNPGVAAGLRQTGEGTEATGHGILESSPTQVERGLAQLKRGQATLESSVASPVAAN